ncbi:MAG: hypothetical protein Ta2G_12420 [Termitinemataceae bacterium]|nr:MAG: hypothetical protein Ta2G_12420 [Termitinemataceae bacterium]
MGYFVGTRRVKNAGSPKIAIPLPLEVQTNDGSDSEKNKKNKKNKKDKKQQGQNTEELEFLAAANTKIQEEQRVRNAGKIVFMIDDAGNNLSELDPFLKLDFPLTIAVLPSLPHSKEAAKRIRAAGKTLFLHQPMEAINGSPPGPGAIYTGLSREEVFAVLRKNMEEVGPIAGINNHQGSKITMDKNIMTAVIDFCKENNLIFLDSRTTADTVVPEIAYEKNIKFAERSIFLDNVASIPAIQKQIDKGILLSERKKYVVMIGHTWSKQLPPVLRRNQLELTSQGYVFASVVEVL